MLSGHKICEMSADTMIKMEIKRARKWGRHENEKKKEAREKLDRSYKLISPHYFHSISPHYFHSISPPYFHSISPHQYLLDMKILVMMMVVKKKKKMLTDHEMVFVDGTKATREKRGNFHERFHTL